jgi:hypothetical protein
MYPLAHDEDCMPLEVPATAVGWLVRRHGGGRGRPGAVYDRAGSPLVLALDATIDALYDAGCGPGVYRLDAVDASRRPLNVVAYTELSAEDGPEADDDTHERSRHSSSDPVAAMARTMEAMQRTQAERERAYAERERAAAERDRAYAERERAAAERDRAVGEVIALLTGRQTMPATRNAALTGAAAVKQQAAEYREFRKLVKEVQADEKPSRRSVKVDEDEPASEAISMVKAATPVLLPLAGICAVKAGEWMGLKPEQIEAGLKIARDSQADDEGDDEYDHEDDGAERDGEGDGEEFDDEAVADDADPLADPQLRRVLDQLTPDERAVALDELAKLTPGQVAAHKQTLKTMAPEVAAQLFRGLFAAQIRARSSEQGA